MEKQLSTPETTSQKLKILALHGYRQNANVFKAKTGSFRKIIHKWTQFFMITAPHPVLFVDNPEALGNPEAGQVTNKDQYGWFFNRDDKTYRGIRKGGPALGFNTTIELIEQVFEKEGPFDGILGFSQGACMVGLLCDLQHRGLLKNIRFDFAVMISGFKSQSFPHIKYFKESIELPTLHIFGESDEVIPTEMSAALAECFEDPVIVKHPGGHYVPGSATQKEDYQNFFQNLWLQKQYQMEEIDENK